MTSFPNSYPSKKNARPALRHEALTWLLALIAFVAPCVLIPVAKSQRADVDWVRIESLPGDQTIHVVSSAATAPEQVMVASAVGGIHYSLDGGHTWASPLIPPRNETLGITHINDLAVAPDRSDLAYVAIASPSSRPRPMVFVSENGGASWHAEGGLGPKRVTALAYGSSSNSLYFATNSDIYRALVLEGDRWVFIRDNSDLDQAFVASLPAHTNVTEMAIAPLSTATTGLLERSSQILYVGTENRGLFIFIDPAPGTAEDDAQPKALWLSATRDEASLYVREEATIETIALDTARPGVAWVGTHDGIFATMNNGRRWFRLSEQLNGHAVRAIAYDSARNRLFAGLADEGVWYSDDLGVSWDRLAQGMGRLDCHTLAFCSETQTLYAGTNQGLWKLALSSD